MKTKNLLLIAIAVLSLTGCKYDDGAIWDAVKNLEERLITLETWQKQASDEIALLKAITDESDYILSVVPVMEGDTQKGYTITFKKSGTITLLNGQKGDKGDKGDTPLISLKQENDGNWYWTLNGSLMTDASGAPIRANGTNGTDGAPAPTPQLKTGRQLKVASVAGTWEDDAFYLSVDNGKTWSKVSGDKGDTGSGSSTISVSEDVENGWVIFKVNGQQITVPRYDETLSLVITTNDGQVVHRGETWIMEFGSMEIFIVKKPSDAMFDIQSSVSLWNYTDQQGQFQIVAPSREACEKAGSYSETIKWVFEKDKKKYMYSITFKAPNKKENN